MLYASVIFLIAALLFLLFYITAARRKKRKKAGKGKKLLGFLTAVCFIASAVFAIIFIKQQDIKIFDRVKKYDLPEKYVSELEKTDSVKAYPLLPDRLFSQGEDVYFANGKNDAFILRKEEGSAPEFVTFANDAAFIGGEKTLRAELFNDGRLTLDGYLLYSKYDGKTVSFNSKTIAKNVRSCALTSNSLFYVTENDELYAMGFNEYGQLCDTTTKNKQEPVFIMDNVAAADISDTHAMIIDKFGTLYACGDNSYSQLANKNAMSTTEITRVMQGVKDVKTGNYFTLVLAVNGELYTAGTNAKGQLGNGGDEFKAELVPIMSGVDKIEINGGTCAALTYSGELYVWGDNTGHKAAGTEGETLAKPVKIRENVYDFTLTSKAVAVLNKDRDIFISNAEGVFYPYISFGAMVPQALRDKYPADTPDTADEV